MKELSEFRLFLSFYFVNYSKNLSLNDFQVILLPESFNQSVNINFAILIFLILILNDEAKICTIVMKSREWLCISQSWVLPSIY
jgi:hypothetical protein